jgi:multimeric flavodoxin WrbA
VKNLLIVYHSKNGSSARLAQAVKTGAEHDDLVVNVRLKLARDAGVDDVLWCDGLILGTPENFGYMSGALKDFFDRVFYPLEGKVEGLAYCTFISAGNDGSGALSSIQRIVRGFPWRQVHEPIIVRGDIGDEDLVACSNLGMFMAAGIESGLF